MKKYSIAFAFLICVLSCKNDSKTTETTTDNTTKEEKVIDGYVINGTAIKANGEKIALYEIHPNDSLHLVTTTTIENNQFRFTGKVLKPDFYLVRINPNRECKILVSNSSHDVLISDQIFGHEISSTSLTSNSYGYLHHKLNRFIQVEDLYREIHKDASEQKDVAELLDLDEKLAEIVGYKKEIITSFIKHTTEKSLVALILKDRIDFLDFDVVQERFNSLPVNIQNNTTGKFIANYIEEKEPKLPVIAETTKKDKEVVAKKKVEFRPAAYALSGKTHEGSTLSLADISSGKVVLIDFWASWCQPCRVQSPHIVSLYKKYKDRGLVILSVSEDTNETAWVKAIATDHFTWNTHIIDNNKSIAFRYGIEAIPHTVLIDKNGKIAAEKLSGRSLEAKIKQLLNE